MTNEKIQSILEEKIRSILEELFSIAAQNYPYWNYMEEEPQKRIDEAFIHILELIKEKDVLKGEGRWIMMKSKNRKERMLMVKEFL